MLNIINKSMLLFSSHLIVGEEPEMIFVKGFLSYQIGLYVTYCQILIIKYLINDESNSNIFAVEKLWSKILQK